MKIRKKSKIRIILVFGMLFFIGFISSLINVNADYNPEFSDELQYEQFNTLESLDNWFDGIETFYDDSIGTPPSYWVNTGTVSVQDYTHKNVMRLSVGSDSSYFPIIFNFTDDLGVSFWLNPIFDCYPAQSDFYLKIHLNNSHYIALIIHDDFVGVSPYTYRRFLGLGLDTTTYPYTSIELKYEQYAGYPAISWEHFQFDIVNDGGQMKVQLTFSFDDIIGSGFYNWFSKTADFYIDEIEIDCSAMDNYVYFDALSIFNLDNTPIDYYYSQIGNKYTETTTNHNPYTSDDYISMYSTLVDKYPVSDNNYRNELIVDNVISQNYVEPSRVLKLTGTGSDDNKYKVNQFYFKELNETYNEYSNTLLESTDYNSSIGFENYSVPYYFGFDDYFAGGTGTVENWSISLAKMENSQLIDIDDGLTAQVSYYDDYLTTPPLEIRAQVIKMDIEMNYVEVNPNSNTYWELYVADGFGGVHLQHTFYDSEVYTDSWYLNFWSIRDNYPPYFYFFMYDNAGSDGSYGYSDYCNMNWWYNFSTTDSNSKMVIDNIQSDSLDAFDNNNISVHTGVDADYGFTDEFNSYDYSSWSYGSDAVVGGGNLYAVPLISTTDYSYLTSTKIDYINQMGYVGFRIWGQASTIIGYTIGVEVDFGSGYVQVCLITAKTYSTSFSGFFHNAENIVGVRVFINADAVESGLMDRFYFGGGNFKDINCSVRTSSIDDFEKYNNHTLGLGFRFNTSTSFQNVSLYNFSSNSWFSIYSGYSTDFQEISYLIENPIDFAYDNRFWIKFQQDESVIDNQTLDIDYLYVDSTYNYYYEPNNQSLRIKVETYTDSGLLCNYLYWNIDFNNSDGLITWDIFYRESASVPRWSRTPTNPIFHFDDYLDENETLENLQVNTHFFLTEHTNQKWLYIRTQVCFNDKYNEIYEYDKIISLGNNTFYNTQDELKISYIDYFNDNYFNPYTKNCLKGLRTLQLNSTLMKYNFLECGFYKSDLEYYIPPPVPEPVPEPPPPEYEKPAGADYYHSYTSFVFTTSIREVIVGNWSYEFTDFHYEPFEAKFWFDYDAVAYVNADDWGNWGLFGEWNWLRNAVAFIMNLGIGVLNLLNLAFQYIVFGIVVSFNFIVMYLICGLFFCEVLWNIGFYYLILGVVWIIWLLYYTITWLFYEGLEGLVVFLATLFSWLLTVFLWLLTLCTADFNSLFEVVNTAVLQLSEFLLQLFYEIATNMITFVLFVAIYTEITLLILFKYYVSKAKGNTNRAIALQQAYETFLQPLKALWNGIIAIKNMITGWL